MKRLIASSVIVIGCASSAFSEEVLREFSWAELSKAGQLTAGEFQRGQPPAPDGQLKIENTDSGPRTFTVLTIDSPGITASGYAVTGEVRCDGVQGKGYLELWNHFPGGQRYFSRTLAPTGPLKSLEGTSDWRAFSLPFFNNAGPQRPNPTPPEKLVINVILPGPGTVYLGPLRLIQYADGKSPMATPGAWWDDRAGGMLGGILGSGLGCLGAIIGTLGGMGKARRFVLGLVIAGFLTGLLLLGAGVVALIYAQPYAVWYPLFLTGVLCSAVIGGLLPVMRRRYEQLELRRMKALDSSI